jgi:hypothetical protein
MSTSTAIHEATEALRELHRDLALALKELRRSTTEAPDEAETHRLQVETLRAQLARAQATLRSLWVARREGEQTGDPGHNSDPPPEEPFAWDALGTVSTALAEILSQYDRDHPLLLLPVRIETRLVPADTTEGFDLLVRIYPDDVHVHAHDEDLTDEEVTWARYFWTEVWTTRNADPSVTDAAWALLVQRLGLRRASWAASRLRPTELGPKAVSEPFPPTIDTKVEPTWPAVTTKPTSWNRAPRAGLLPSGWVAWGFRQGAVHVSGHSGLVRDDLAVGPDPVTLGEQPGALPISDDVRWMVDFEEALRAGMALRIYLGLQPNDLDALVVFGLRDGLPKDVLSEIEAHFRRLRFGRGLEFLRNGVPTNNTEAVRSDWMPDPPGDASRETMLRELGPQPIPVPDELENAYVWARGLSVALNTFVRVAGARDRGQFAAKAMNKVLWPITWGHYLPAMVAPLVPPGLGAWLPDHWVDYVRGGGPFPPVRVGRQPYGMLPVVVGEVLDPANFHQNLEVFVRTARSHWDTSTVPHLHPGSPDSDRDLVHTLGTLAYPQRFAVRGFVERARVAAAGGNNFALVGPGSVLHDLIMATGVPAGWQNAQILNGLFTAGSREWVKPLVTAAPLSPVDPLPGNFIAWMAHKTTGSLQNENHGFEKDTLLYVLMREAGIRAASHSAPASEWRAPAGYLASLPTTQLEQLLRETLGASAHRLDVWETSLASLQLELSRQAIDADPLKEPAVGAGVFGWVEDLRFNHLVEEPEGTAPVDPDNRGYIHAPTLNHGVTAAVMRNGWFSHGGGADQAMAVDLSSARARGAKELLDGVRRGIGLSESLGYRFERLLHEGIPSAELDQYIDDFRAFAPLVTGQRAETQTSDDIAKSGAAAVVDGLKLVALWRESDPTLAAMLGGLGLTPSQRADIEAPRPAGRCRGRRSDGGGPAPRAAGQHPAGRSHHRRGVDGPAPAPGARGHRPHADGTLGDLSAAPAARSPRPAVELARSGLVAPGHARAGARRLGGGAAARSRHGSVRRRLPRRRGCSRHAGLRSGRPGRRALARGARCRDGRHPRAARG